MQKEVKYIYISLVILFTFLVILTGVIGQIDGTFTKTLHRDSSDPSQLPQNFSGVSISSNFTSVDLDYYTYRLHFSFRPFGDYLDRTDLLQRSVSEDLFLAIDSDTISFLREEIMISKDLMMPIQSGFQSNYPFDGIIRPKSNIIVYQSEFFIHCVHVNNITNSKLDVPLSISISNSLQGWRSKITIQDVSATSDYSLINISIEMSRAISQKFFSLFIFALMWVLSLGIFLMAFTHIRYSKRVESPTLGVVTTMLFALPAVRNVQGTHVIGCLTDLTGFFWNMGLVASSGKIKSLMIAIFLIWRYSFQDSLPYVLSKDSTTDLEMVTITKSMPINSRTDEPGYLKLDQVESTRLLG